MGTVVKAVVAVVVVAGVAMGLQASGVLASLRFETLVESKEALRAWVADQGPWALLTFLGVYILATALSVPGATLLTLTAGFLFGPLVGTLVANVGATLGAMAVFLLTRNLLGRGLQDRYRAAWETFNKTWEREGTSYLLALRLIPAVPFFLVNILAGLTTVRAPTFLWTTSVGILAGSFVYALAGSNLATVTHPSQVLSGPVVLSLVLLGLLALVPVLVRRFQALRARKGARHGR